jgi:hypothetical protein
MSKTPRRPSARAATPVQRSRPRPGRLAGARARGSSWQRLCLGTISAAVACTLLQVGCTREPGRPMPVVETGGLPQAVYSVPFVASWRDRPRADFRLERPSPQARRVADWVLATADHRQRPFVLIDKRHARLYVLDAEGLLLGAAPVLLGLAPGDDSVPGIGERPLAEVRPPERTTPAGRFVGEAGRNLGGEDVVWVDYEAAVSMHRVRATKPAERRLERLTTLTPADNRISYGCINLPAAFYDRVVSPAFAGAKAMVYVLPETRSVDEQFGLNEVPLRSARRSRPGASAEW